jgi:hypothetical protein
MTKKEILGALGVLGAAVVGSFILMLGAMAMAAYVWPLMAPGTCP